MSRTGDNPFLDKLIVIAAENIAWWCGLDAPDQACHDAAALAHAAYSRLSAQADIEAITARAHAASRAIAAKHGAEGLEEREATLIANLRHHHFQARSVPAARPRSSTPIAACPANGPQAMGARWLSR